jgi:host factor-I protein
MRQRGSAVHEAEGHGMATPRTLPLQDAYLAEVKRQAVPVTIYLMNGFQLRGVVKGFDPFTIVLEYEKKAHLIYKHAVSTISPMGPVAAPLVPEDEGVEAS